MTNSNSNSQTPNSSWNAIGGKPYLQLPTNPGAQKKNVFWWTNTVAQVILFFAGLGALIGLISGFGGDPFGPMILGASVSCMLLALVAMSIARIGTIIDKRLPNPDVSG